MLVTLEHLRAISPHSPAAKLALLIDPLNEAMEEFEINTPLRQTAFLAQVAHESAGFTALKEFASGEKYEGRKDLGNTEPGDGARFKGRGPLQITGRKNYGLCGQALGLDLLEHPELLEEPINACRSAGWFWRVGAGLNLSRRARNERKIPEGVDLNALADVGEFEDITIAINGWLNGQDDRLAKLELAQGALA